MAISSTRTATVKRETRPCAWAQKNPQKNLGHGDHCFGWSCLHHPDRCDRKATWERHRKAEASSYRKFPGSDVEQARVREKRSCDPGRCRWCGGEIVRADGHAVDKRRTWHSGKGSEPDCLWDFYCHTRQPEQLIELLQRHGPCCAKCGDVTGRWFRGREIDPVECRNRADPYWAKTYPAKTYVGPFQQIAWEAGLEVDHVLALALVVLLIPPADQWRYWGPMNLQGLCNGCHKAKTADDVRKIRAARALADVPEAI